MTKDERRARKAETHDTLHMTGIHKILVVHSGGLDSTVLLAELRALGRVVRSLSIDYGQRHRRELDFAARSCARLNVDHEVASLPGLAGLLGGSSQTDDTVPVPEGHYTDESMKTTVVPNRNMILLSVAVGRAVALGFQGVAYAAHAGDHAVYADCRPKFAKALARAVELCDDSEPLLLRPYVKLTKAQVVRRGARVSAPFDLTWSCYKGESVHCGRCGTCVERVLAFRDAGVADPTTYADPDYAARAEAEFLAR